MRQIELLSPAKDLETGIATINCGADAVYIGATQFGARQAAGNSIEDIEKLIQYAHKFNVKVYTTLNTVLFDNEMEDCNRLIYQLYNIGTDALIIQDLGILELNLPPIPLHSSTQMHNANKEQVKFLEQVGFTRAILARELSIEQIKDIHDNTSIELESFIHGSLCVSYSGRCFMSKHITDRSGNRGECTQPCRSYYNLLNINNEPFIKHKHLLSLKDLNLTNSIADMIDAGIMSLKIEGRLKDITYVKNIVSHYRKTIDNILEGRTNCVKSSSGNVETNFTPDPERTFNRQYTNYFIDGRHSGNISPFTQKSFGKKIGKVVFSGKNFIEVENGKTVNNGDGLCYLDTFNTMQGFNVSRTDGDMIAMPDDKEIPTKGTIIYRNFDFTFEKSVMAQNAVKRKIKTDILLTETEKGIKLTAIDADGNIATSEVEIDKVEANNPEMASNSLKSLLSKSGDTIFAINNIKIDTSRTYIFKSATINSLRRELLEALDVERLSNYKQLKAIIDKNNIPYPQAELTRYDNITNEYAKTFYNRHGIEKIERGVDAGEPPVFLMTTKHCIKYELGLCPKNTNPFSTLRFDKEKAQEPFTLQDSTNSYLLNFDCHKCVMNVIKK